MMPLVSQSTVWVSSRAKRPNSCTARALREVRPLTFEPNLDSVVHQRDSNGARVFGKTE